MAKRRGRLRVLLGAAPGVGKTVAMLEEGSRMAAENVDVVVALVETHGRRVTAERVGSLEVIPRREVTHRRVTLTDMDLPAVLARAPQVALVDELAHTNAPGGVHEKRWEDVEDLLDAGIDVITTVNIQHIESLNDVVQSITGIVQRETVPDDVVRRADRIEVVDLTPRALRERLEAGQVYPTDRIDAALSNYFRLGNLTALRELALLWLADEVDSALAAYRAEHGIDSRWEARERVVVALAGGPEGETLLRRGARIASRSSGGRLLAVHVTAADGLRAPSAIALQQQRQLVEQLGGTFHQLVGDDVPATLIDFARSVNATQLVVGVSHRSNLARLLGGPSIGSAVIRSSGDIDVHIVTHDQAGGRFALPRLSGAITWRRQLTAQVIALMVIPLLTWWLTSVRNEDSMATSVLVYQVVVILVTLLGGVWAALTAAVLSGFLLDFFLIRPFYTVTIADPWHLFALILYLASGLLVGLVVDRSARTAVIARRRAAESELLASLTGAMLRSNDPVTTLLNRTREAFGMHAVALRRDGREVARSVDTYSETRQGSGEDMQDGSYRSSHRDTTSANEAVIQTIPVGQQASLELIGPVLDGRDRRLVGAIADHLQVELERADLTQAARIVEPLEEADKVRRALLVAVGHDVRRPLAAATTAVDGLLDPAVTSESDRLALLSTARTSLANLKDLVTNLLDVSRLQSGQMAVHLAPTDVESCLLPALEETGADPARLTLDLDPAVPQVLADGALLVRVLVNLLANAMRHSPDDQPVTVSTSSFGDLVEIRVADRGPGVPPERRDDMFRPFQRLGDTDNETGLGLGLALTQGFVEGMRGVLEAETTPGGGLTMCVQLRVAPALDDGDGQTDQDVVASPGPQSVPSPPTPEQSSTPTPERSSIPPIPDQSSTPTPERSSTPPIPDEPSSPSARQSHVASPTSFEEHP
ncbi:sensor histidine kinase [Devriesea agamarum]|uniref:sensor histidine kinase n=1 Tax=Devriesea agamarum TaxID=472569 RepID=UPI0022B224F2|nr:ATP-binding protein [Devriesea agamarum]